jgi:uncharacterized protein YkwD
MGRHRRTSAEPVPPSLSASGRSAHGRGTDRRRNPPARTGLLGASAALAVGAVAVTSGLVPVPGGLPGLSGRYTFGAPDDAPGNLPRADGTPTTPVRVAAPASPPSRGSVPTSRDTGRTAVPGGATPTASSSTSVTPSPSAPATALPTQRGTASAAPTASSSTDGTADTDGANGTDAPYGTSGQAAAPGANAHAVRQVLALVNQERAKAGCVPLTEDPRLGTLAQDFSQEMASHGFFGHTGPDGKSPWDRAASLGIADLGGENIARGQADALAVMDTWMNSPGHRANILDCEYHTIGIGVDFGSGGPWWTQDFGF